VPIAAEESQEELRVPTGKAIEASVICLSVDELTLLHRALLVAFGGESGTDTPAQPIFEQLLPRLGAVVPLSAPSQQWLVLDLGLDIQQNVRSVCHLNWNSAFLWFNTVFTEFGHGGPSYVALAPADIDIK